jgi:uncharacterized protein (DUF1330 family)
MSKGYIFADIHVRDKEGFEKFREMAKPVIEEYNAKVLVRAPNAEAKEGRKPGIVVVLEFDSMNKARKFHESEEYKAAKTVREKACDTDLFFVEGLK